MARLDRPKPQSEERFLERFEARDIELDDQNESMPDGNRGIVAEDDSSTKERVYDK